MPACFSFSASIDTESVVSDVFHVVHLNDSLSALFQQFTNTGGFGIINANGVRARISLCFAMDG